MLFHLVLIRINGSGAECMNVSGQLEQEQSDTCLSMVSQVSRGQVSSSCMLFIHGFFFTVVCGVMAISLLTGLWIDNFSGMIIGTTSAETIN